MALIKSSHVAFNAVYALNPWPWTGINFSSDIGDYRAKKVDFKTCAIMDSSIGQGQPNENREH
jgi:hypothetical protein